ncbi:hypothetical protein Mucpa_4116 [Mucilaginibacter paludis DSM 18603]|uniref:Uncharacterized protein n=2 Tax=Mucilaginibacter TaxID=423349 RepID=H1Y2M8_9SPHI|nr:hypothetical protein Mucpa_4116 [Mucilaginibacter paludis DSM 18603]
MLLYVVLMASQVVAQSKPTSSPQLSGFRELLSNIKATFTLPEGFKETTPPNNEKLPFQYGVENPDADCEIWFQVNSVKAEWQRHERDKADAVRQLINPDSLYIKTVEDEAAIMSSENNYIARNIPTYILDQYNADEGRSYLLALTDLPATKHYQYALLIALNKKRTGNIIMACLTNERGPYFFKTISKLKRCLKFSD